MKKLFMNTASILAIGTILVACGGRPANPVMIQQYGDQNKSCEVVQHEMGMAQNEIHRIAPQTSKTGKNVGLGVAGVFFFPAWFFMDFKNADRQEYEAWRNRYNHLGTIAASKKCGIEKEQFPTMEELEAEIEKKRAEQEKNK